MHHRFGQPSRGGTVTTNGYNTRRRGQVYEQAALVPGTQAHERDAIVGNVIRQRCPAQVGRTGVAAVRLAVLADGGHAGQHDLDPVIAG
ncbi:MAG TPA: hypothetical protein VGI74_15305 [Streptosporangiaceae bacterium]